MAKEKQLEITHKGKIYLVTDEELKDGDLVYDTELKEVDTYSDTWCELAKTNSKKLVEKPSILQEILDSITPEQQAKFDANFKAHEEYMDAHPDYNERYGTDKSYWLEEIRAKGFNPIGITVMICEETIIMETKEEIEKAWEIFKPEGWWYTAEQWEETRKDYVKDMYKGVVEDAPKVYCLNEKYSHLFGDSK